MINKRRDLENVEVMDLRSSNRSIHEEISILSNVSLNDGVRVEQFHLLPEFGKGQIIHYRTQEISITISKYLLNSDLDYTLSESAEVLQISFLLKGEKIIKIKGNEDIFFENRESYLANIKDLNGSVRISGGKLFKEVKIKLPKSFLIDHGFVNDMELKKLTDENVILPITDELFTILMSLERKDISGTANRMYLKAKVFELMAIQMESYKNKDLNFGKINSDKTIKRLYAIRQVIKSNLHKNLSLKQLTVEAGMNGNTLNREFNRVFGCTISEYSSLEKMGKAKFMLENTENLVYQIAEEVGYKNATHFSAAFKRKFGITPNEYRKHL